MVRLAFILLVLVFAPAAFGSESGKTLVVMGDSISAGYGVEPEEAFPAVLEQKIKQAGLLYRVVNAGVSGDTTAGGLRRISWLLRQPIDVLLLELGGNDGLRGISPAETEKNLQGIIDKVRGKYPEAMIILAGMQMPSNMGEEYTREFRELFPRLAKKNKTALVPFLLDGVGGKPELNLPDRIHPTPEGHRMIAETVWKTVEPLLNKSSPAKAAGS